MRSCELDRSADIYVAAAVDAAADAAAAYVLVRTFHVDVNTATLVICEAGSSLSLSLFLHLLLYYVRVRTATFPFLPQQMARSGNKEESKRIMMDLEVVQKSHDCPHIVTCFGTFVTDVSVVLIKLLSENQSKLKA